MCQLNLPLTKYPKCPWTLHTTLSGISENMMEEKLQWKETVVLTNGNKVCLLLKKCSKNDGRTLKKLPRAKSWIVWAIMVINCIHSLILFSDINRNN